MQLYRGLPIGTAQPTEEERRGVPHHLIGILDPNEACSAARYAAMASACVADILNRGRLPVVAGGTGLYAAALLGGLRLDAPPSDPDVRRQLEERDTDALFAELRRLDPSAKVTPGDRRRVIRALEIITLGGRLGIQSPSTSLVGSNCPWEPELIGLAFPERAELYARIDARVDRMFEAGLAAEALSVKASGGAAQAIGYKEIWAAAEAGLPPESAKDAIKQATRRYAKRQLTWFRRDKSIRWIDAGAL
jgi:tRNA dimethylallyltransferase